MNEAGHELIFPIYEQRSQLRVVVIPAPAFAQQVLLLEVAHGHQSPADGVHPKSLYALYKSLHVLAFKHGVHAAHTIDVARKHAVSHLALIAQSGAEFIVTPQLVDGRHSRKQFHGRGGPHGLLGIECIQRRVGRQVIHHQSELCPLQQRVLHQRVESCLDILRPRQFYRHGISYYSIRNNFVGLRLQTNKTVYYKESCNIYSFHFKLIIQFRRYVATSFLMALSSDSDGSIMLYLLQYSGSMKYSTLS